MKLNDFKKVKQFFKTMAVTIPVIFLACSEDGNSKKEDEIIPTNEIVTGLISSNQTWTSDRIYELSGRVIVNEGITLTIEPGTIIKGQEGNGTNATVLIVARGGKLIADGTTDKPIIFTSVLDNITVGQLIGTNLSEEDKELWGGLIVLGKAPISAENGDDESSIEGLPADETYGLYGGSDITDNSGSLKYISIRHGGITIGEGNEINGLTLGGVGNGTTITNIEIYATLDDGIEFFGGSVNISNALVYFQGDDGIDIDQNFSGTVENFLVIHGGTDTDEGLEIDGPEGSLKDGLFTLKNGTLKSTGGSRPGTAADLKSKAQGTLDNILFDYNSNAVLKLRTSYDSECNTKEDALTHFTDANPTLIIKNSQFEGVAVYTSSETCSVLEAEQSSAEGRVTSTVATGADKSVFGWTAAAANGQID